MSFVDLPDELKVNILARLSDYELADICKISSRFRSICRDNQLWRMLVRRRFGNVKIVGDNVYSIYRYYSVSGKIPTPRQVSLDLVGLRSVESYSLSYLDKIALFRYNGLSDDDIDELMLINDRLIDCFGHRLWYVNTRRPCPINTIQTLALRFRTIYDKIPVYYDDLRSDIYDYVLSINRPSYATVLFLRLAGFKPDYGRLNENKAEKLNLLNAEINRLYPEYKDYLL